MFRKNWFRAVVLMTVLASLLVAPLLVGAQEMTNGLALTEGATVSGTVEVKGYASDPNFAKWDLYILPGGDDSAKIFVANGETPGEFTVSVDTTNFPDGEHAFSLRVVKTDSNYDEYVTKFVVANATAAAAPAPAAEPTAAMTTTTTTTATVAPAPAAALAAAAPTNGITSPKANAKVSGTATVTGVANDPNFMKWQLDVLPGGNGDAAIFVALGETAGEFSQDIDTTAFPDGDHALRLRVVKNDSNYDEYVTPFTVANASAPAAAPAPAATAAVTATAATTPTAVAPAATPAPAAAAAVANGFTNVKDGDKVSGTVEVKGVANDPNFLKWDLYILPGGDDSAKIFVANGETPGEFMVSIDTTNFPNGEHVLSLRVVDGVTQNYKEYQVKFVVDNAAPAQ